MATIVRTVAAKGVAVMVVTMLGLFATGCGDDGSSADPTDEPTATPTASDDPTAEPTPKPSPEPVGPGQPALWPAAGKSIDDPVEAAQDFLDTVLQAGEAGEFRQGDARSGEVDALFTGESGDRSIVRSTLLLRQLGSDSGWFVIAAVNPNAAITAPDSLAEVPASSLSVEGLGRGFEGTLNVSARLSGVAGEPLDLQVTAGGSAAKPLPFSTTLDLTGAVEGDVVTIMVRGGTGLETDPGDFGAIPVVIGR